jgi:hypothetical protein
MDNQKLFDYELSKEMDEYLKDISEQIERKEGNIYEKLSTVESDSIDVGYGIATEAGYDLDREEFEKVVNDVMKLQGMISKEDGELDLEALEMIAGGMTTCEKFRAGFGGTAGVVIVVALIGI